MRYRGGGIGHKSTRDATQCVYKDRDPLDLATEGGDAAELLAETEVQTGNGNKGEEDGNDPELEDDSDECGEDSAGEQSGTNEEDGDSNSDSESRSGESGSEGSQLDDMEGFGEL